MGGGAAWECRLPEGADQELTSQDWLDLASRGGEEGRATSCQPEEMLQTQARGSAQFLGVNKGRDRADEIHLDLNSKDTPEAVIHSFQKHVLRTSCEYGSEKSKTLCPCGNLYATKVY